MEDIVNQRGYKEEHKVKKNNNNKTHKHEVVLPVAVDWNDQLHLNVRDALQQQKDEHARVSREVWSDNIAQERENDAHVMKNWGLFFLVSISDCLLSFFSYFSYYYSFNHPKDRFIWTTVKKEKQVEKNK